MSPKAPPKDELISITQLGEIINREANTIRKWEREGVLPKKLHPRRGDRGWRYWTHAQVYGKDGIIKWMERKDMRPGRALADPAHADTHVKNLRRPKYLNKHLVKLIRTMVQNGASASEIIEEIYPHTKYASEENFESAVRGYFTKQGWVFPPSSKREQKGK